MCARKQFFGDVRFLSEVEDFVISGKRPELTEQHCPSAELRSVIFSCWQNEPSSRPNFSDILPKLFELVVKPFFTTQEIQDLDLLLEEEVNIDLHHRIKPETDSEVNRPDRLFSVDSDLTSRVDSTDLESPPSSPSSSSSPRPGSPDQVSLPKSLVSSPPRESSPKSLAIQSSKAMPSIYIGRRVSDDGHHLFQQANPPQSPPNNRAQFKEEEEEISIHSSTVLDMSLFGEPNASSPVTSPRIWTKPTTNSEGRWTPGDRSQWTPGDRSQWTTSPRSDRPLLPRVKS
eukprot:TRINITY_DN6140_c0_g1_i1.p1 TRINITY_DN6140_c0_g1~~TRINITY_DN6140_c0_g1_i1.p1  ORF type:complete len:332 (-),score=82.24 TRINITY_DN6140_c0_g1_i1:46-906(-)